MAARPVKVAYVHGRPAPHPNRLRLLPAIGAELIPVDFKLPWAHLAAPPRWRKYLSLVVCAATFPERRRWDLLVGDGPQHLPVLMKALRLLGPNQKAVPYLAGEFPYFLATGYYGPRRTALLRWWFARWDAYLCLGPMVEDLVRGVIPPHRQGDVFTIQNFVREDRLRELQDVTPDLRSLRLLFIGHGPSGFRVFYKGLDLMVEAFARARKSLPALHWSIAGEWDSHVRQAMEARCGIPAGSLSWLGSTPRLREILASHALYFHCARGDAWPNSVMEAMVAGVPPLVSEWTGVRDLVAQVDGRLVVPLDPDAIAERIAWYFSLPPSERTSLGERARELIRGQYTESRATEVFRATVRRLLDRLDLEHLELPPWPSAAPRNATAQKAPASHGHGLH